jgi:hypothetical protein
MVPGTRSREGGLLGSVATRVVVRRSFGTALAMVLALSLPAVASPCSLPSGRTVILKSEDIDPDVFVWDSRQRVVDYAAGFWHDTHDVLVHSLLAKPGTRAVVVQCDPGVVRPKYVADSRDAVGVRLINGPNRGRYGWVTSQDVHALEH